MNAKTQILLVINLILALTAPVALAGVMPVRAKLPLRNFARGHGFLDRKMAEGIYPSNAWIFHLD